MHKLKELASNLGIALLLCLSIGWLTDRDPPVTYGVVRVATHINDVAEPPPRPGGEIPLYVAFSRDRICKTFADRRFLDSVRGEFSLEDDIWTPSETAPHGTYVHKFIPLPARVHPGLGTLTLDVTWRCNPIHWVWPIRTTVKVPVMVAPRVRPFARLQRCKRSANVLRLCHSKNPSGKCRTRANPSASGARIWSRAFCVKVTPRSVSAAPRGLPSTKPSFARD